MGPRDATGAFLAALVAAAPSYLVERITEYYFLSGNSALFFMWSSARTGLFIILIFLAATESGYAIRSFKVTVVGFTAGIVILSSLLYLFCPSKVCYSTGIDGLEPLRFAYFFGCLGIAGASIGRHARAGGQQEKSIPWLSLVSAVGIGAITYYPVVFTMAGTKLLTPIAPLPVLAILFLVSLFFAGRLTTAAGLSTGFVVTLGANVIVLLMTLGIARQYLPQISTLVLLMVVSSLVGALLGCTAAAARRYRPSLQSNKILAAALLILMLSTVFFLPDAVAGVTPETPASGAASSFAIGPSVYVGGFATQSFVRVGGVSVGVSFAGTNASVIQAGNYLSGGLGVHAANCCVDGIDYGYRFDVYLFHDGTEALVATSWEDCDWIMACGGHSWQDLLFLRKEVINASLSVQLHLFLQWEGKNEVTWTYSIDGGPVSNFTSFSPPAQENPYFTVGTLGGIPSNPQAPSKILTSSILSAIIAPGAKGFYFFQYGLMSSHPIGHLGWQVAFSCPSYLENTAWTCLDHSDSLQGDQAYWKVIWRWGEPYYGVGAKASAGPSPSVTFSYSPSTISSFSPLW